MDWFNIMVYRKAAVKKLVSRNALTGMVWSLYLSPFCLSVIISYRLLHMQKKYIPKSSSSSQATSSKHSDLSRGSDDRRPVFSSGSKEAKKEEKARKEEEKARAAARKEEERAAKKAAKKEKKSSTSDFFSKLKTKIKSSSKEKKKEAESGADVGVAAAAEAAPPGVGVAEEGSGKDWDVVNVEAETLAGQFQKPRNPATLGTSQSVSVLIRGVASFQRWICTVDSLKSGHFWGQSECPD